MSGQSVTYPRVAYDWYVEPQSVTERLLAAEKPFNGAVLEPCCGQGNVARAFSHHTGREMETADIRHGMDFRQSIPSMTRASIITNPPYKHAQELAELALQHTTDRVCVFLRLAFLEGRKRSAWMEGSPLARVWVLPDRVNCVPGHLLNQPQRNGGKVAYAWFVWEHGHSGPPHIGWLQPAHHTIENGAHS